MGSLKPDSNWKNYGSVSGIPTVGKNNLPRGGKVANAFCYTDFEQSRAATPSQTNPNVMFFRRANSVMASTRSINNRTVGSTQFGTNNNVALY